MLANALTC